MNYGWIASMIIGVGISVFLIYPLFLFCGSKLFRVYGVSFKTSISTSIFISVLVFLALILKAFLSTFGSIGPVVGFVLVLASLLISVLIIERKFDTSLAKSIAVFVFFLLVYSCMALVTRTFIVKAYKMPARSMKPTLLVGDFILADKYEYYFTEPKRGDIIVFPLPEDPSKDFMKRVVGVEGDEIEIKDKKIYVNQQKLIEAYAINTDPHIIPKGARPRDNFGPITVPPNSLFVLGDNRDHSYDSRFWGFVDKRKVKGKVSTIYWSWDQDKFRVRWGRIGVSLDSR